MTYDDAMTFWFGRINFEVKAARPDDLKLERMQTLLRLLGSPQDRFRSLHITGTKGKGSTAAMLDAVLREAGFRVGLFTSPHLEHVSERVQVNGQAISKNDLAICMGEIAKAVNELDRVWPQGTTFFEIGTALGFLYFARMKVDFAVVEVGLGGRFDSTNVIMPMVSVITTVGLDHVIQLGSTLEAIAFQKAGIIKPRTPVVCGVTQPGPLNVIKDVAREMQAPLAVIGRDFGVWDGPLSLRGQHQRLNAGVAKRTIDELRAQGVAIDDDAVRRGLENVFWPARVEVVSQSPIVILDSAHNEPSIEALIATLNADFPGVRNHDCVFAVSNDKPYREMLAKLDGWCRTIVLTKYASNPRCVPPETLLSYLKKSKVIVQLDPFRAYDDLRASARPGDMIIITGSMFLAGDLRKHVVT